jgi:SPP1 gp7 family putative phage head morphogenesis protein
MIMTLVIVLCVAGLVAVQYSRRKTGDNSENARTKTSATRVLSYGDNVGAKIYDGLRKEMAGETGQRVLEILRQSCLESPLTKLLSERTIDYIQEESLKGRRAENIAEDLQTMLPGVAKVKLHAIAGTVISKASTALTRAQAEDMDVEWYCWETCRDNRVRPSHKLMDGVLIKWNEPPEPEILNGEEGTGHYHAGEEEGCRCYAAPLLRLSSVKWPHRVHVSGTIVRMTKTKFKGMSGITN